MPYETCYMCDEQATTQEHAPPKCIFPESSDMPRGEDYRKNLIKVPSCPEHNCSKSKDDEYFLYILSASFTSNDVAMNQFLTKVKRAMERRPRLANQLAETASPVKIHDTEHDVWHEAFAIKVEATRIDAILQNCARALYFHETNRKFRGEAQTLSAFLLSPHNRQFNDAMAAAFQKAAPILDSHPSKGDNPKVLSYKIITHENSAIVYMEFYETSKTIIRLKGE